MNGYITVGLVVGPIVFVVLSVWTARIAKDRPDALMLGIVVAIASIVSVVIWPLYLLAFVAYLSILLLKGPNDAR